MCSPKSIRLVILLVVLFYLLSCKEQSTSSSPDSGLVSSKGALLATDFSSLEELSENIKIAYEKPNPILETLGQNPRVRLTQKGYGNEVSSILGMGLNEDDITEARDGGKLKQLKLALSSPNFTRNRQDLLRVYILARRDFKTFGEGDAAFYDLAERMLYNIDDDDLSRMSSSDLSEKGYLNTFNHITAQVFMTLLFSEELADLVADIHERTNMEELVTGAFTESQLGDLETGPIDNYVDMINNEWGQELGKELKTKHNITRATKWTTELLAKVLNDIQAYYGWVFQIGFEPFQSTDEKVIRFSSKLNQVM